MKKVWVYIAADCLIGVYETKHLADTQGHLDSAKRFGITGTFEEATVICTQSDSTGNELLSCDCYGGCWGDHSANWPSIEYKDANEAARIRNVVPYGRYVDIGTPFALPGGVMHILPKYLDKAREAIK